MKASRIGLLTLVSIFILNMLFLKKCGENKEKECEYKGVLIEIFIDEENRSQYTYKILTSQGYVYSTVRSYPESFNYIEIGDSILKKRGELSITIKKKKYDFHRMTTFTYD